MLDTYNELEMILEGAAAEWRHKREDYGDAFLELGAKGQFSEIWRKVKKLQRAVWEERRLSGEQAEQIAAEIIPHCLMMIYCLRRAVPSSPRSIGTALEDIKAGDALDIDLENGMIRRAR